MAFLRLPGTVMDTRLVHPEDRRRDGGCDIGRGCGDEDGDTVRARYRSEAFAEDLSQDGRPLLSHARQGRTIRLTVTRPATTGRPLLGLTWIAAFGLRGALRD
jgi:hypothetical protein